MSLAVRVTEIFFSIQGESTHVGRPCVFVRFTGCDLRCGYCDTAYAFHGGAAKSREEILAEVAKHPSKFVCLTGGEPLLQKELPDLAQELLDRGYDVSVETHGQQPFDRLPAAVHRIVDLKTPGSGEVHRDFSLLAALTKNDELKVVVTSRDDFQWAVDRIREHQLDEKAGTVLFSPVHGAVDPKALAEWLLASGLNARLQLQLHKIIWGAEARGV
jgi:7-carboxy-7-deazaguanine synthase